MGHNPGFSKRTSGRVMSGTRSSLKISLSDLCIFKLSMCEAL